MPDSLVSKAAGALRLDVVFGDTWEAVAPLAVPFFDGQQVQVAFDCGAVPEAGFMRAADAALLNLLALGEAERLAVTDAVMANYQQALLDDGEPLPLTQPSDIWQYIQPRHLLVRFEEDEAQHDIYLLIEAECAWEVEHGLQLVFRQGRMLTRMSQCDGHLTESSAEGIAEEQDALMMRYYAAFGRPTNQ
ncbi:hypothetical protein GCM10022409_05720 [Hymenobacter glaciei]|uniref:DUF6985 domain-containing protein n=1 Tax=Hymenobacter glaciei TaxID=877209 RepID=A0ABP7TDM0_9BACT